MKNSNEKAFTLAETMIVLVVLGVVASITIPAMVNRHVEAERRTKLRKAMTVYDTALSKIIIENDLKSQQALENWADSDTKNDCANTSAYFKAARNLEVNGAETNCKFRASDGVFWDISDITKPLVALREQDLNDATAQSDTNRAFYMFGRFDENGSLRTNDLGKIDATDKADLAKLYDFIAGKTKTSLGEIANHEEPVNEPINNQPIVSTPTNFMENISTCTTERKGCKRYVTSWRDNEMPPGMEAEGAIVVYKNDGSILYTCNMNNCDSDFWYGGYGGKHYVETNGNQCIPTSTWEWEDCPNLSLE